MLGILGLLACDGTPATMAVPDSPSRTLSGQSSLRTEIDRLIDSGFPRGQALAIDFTWDLVVRALAREQRVTLRGRVVPGAGARAVFVRLADYIQRKTSITTPPSGETQAHFVARLVLDMSLYVYGGPSTPVPTVDPGSDVAFKLVQPGRTDTVATPALKAAVIFPPGSVGEPTVVVITPDTAYYPANCSGPLDTHLCQYPKFYRFNVFPDVKLGVSAKVQVCHVDAGINRLPLAKHDRFRVAHEKPANEADYTAGSTIVDNVEVLPLTPMSVTACAAGDGTQYLPPIGAANTPLSRFTTVAMGLVHRAGTAARRLFVPQDVYAIDIGGGGLVDDFSMFGVVDPSSIADLAQATTQGAQFSLVSSVLPIGGSAQVNAWSIRNAGSGTSAAFTSSVVIATDSLLTTPVATVALGGAATLVPASTFAYAGMSLALPEGVVAGTYFIGTRVLPTGADSSASDNLVSVRVVVGSTQTVGAAAWTGTGPGTVTATVNSPTLVTLGYSSTYSPNESIVNIDGHYVFPWQQWTYSTNAVSSGTYTFHWQYTGNHTTFNAYAKLEAFANGPDSEVVVPLVPYVSYLGDYGNVREGFDFSGSATLTLTAGYAWGVRPAGYSYDERRTLDGALTLTEQVIIP